MTWTIPDQGEAANDLQSELFQSSLDALAAGDALTGVVSGCAVTAQGSPDMTVAVAAGVVSVLGVQATVASGNVTIGAADGTNPRLDLIVANASGTKSVIAGVAAAAPKEATLDTSTYVLLAQVYVPAAATTITTARITDRRVMVVGPVTQSTQSGTTYTLTLADAGTVVRCTNAAAVTVTVPPSSSVAWLVGTIINVYGSGAGGVSFSPGSGVTIQNNSTSMVQYGECSLRYDATDSWIRLG